LGHFNINHDTKGAKPDSFLLRALRFYARGFGMKRRLIILLACCGLLSGTARTQSQSAMQKKPRARDIIRELGVFEPGPLNAITDVAGVKVGHTTIIEGDAVRTGVTAILPHGGNLFQDKVAGGVFVGNAFGKLAGSTQVEELGTIETPIVLTNTLAVGTAVEAVVAYTLAQTGNAEVRSVNALVGETNDGALNDIRGQHVKRQHVLDAIRNALAGPVAEGSVGAGTGTICYGWKGGIGTSSRRLSARHGGYMVGVLAQTNFGGVLSMGGAPVGRELGRYAFQPPPSPGRPGGEGDGSCMIVVATDAPLDARDLRRVAARAVFALARTGSSFSNGSGDFAIAFTTSADLRVKAGGGEFARRAILPTDAVSPIFQATLEATEEAIYNSLLQATKVSNRKVQGVEIEAIPVDRVVQILKKYNLGN
jgi:D-aminopeptidase